jgi:ABC-type multidrug transport system permease subunit
VNFPTESAPNCNAPSVTTSRHVHVQGAANGLSAIFFSIAYMQFLGLAECAETMMRLPVFYKQKYSLLFPGWAYAIPFGIVRVPITLIEVTLWSVMVYWLVGLEANAGRCARWPQRR